MSEISPTMDKDQLKSEITFSDIGTAPKLTSIDERRLSEQISRFKSKDAKSANQDLAQTEKHKIILNKNGWKRNFEKDQIEMQVDGAETLCHTTGAGKTDNIYYPVKASNSEFKKPWIKTQQKPIIYKSCLNENRKRTFNEISDTDDKIKSLNQDLREPAIPLSKLQQKRSKVRENEEENVAVNIKKARRRDKARRRQLKELSNDEMESSSSSSSSESSESSVTSNERDELIRKYFKKILWPIFEEEREQNKKETMQILEGNGLIELAKRKDLINFDNIRKNDPAKDPFLEDEGFLPSDISGATTPKKISSGIYNAKGSEMKDSNKAMSSIHSLEEDKYSGAMKRINSKVDNQKQNIIISNQMPMKSYSKVDTHKENVDQDMDSQSMATISKKSEIKTTSIFNSTKPQIERNKSENTENKDQTKENTEIINDKIESNTVNKEVSIPIKEKESELAGSSDNINKNEEKSEKPKLKSIFGPSQNIIEELKQCRSSNNSSPSFGESKNLSEDKIANKLIQNKPITSIFSQKPAIIEESPNEEDQALQEETNKNQKPIEKLPTKVPEVTPAPFTRIPQAKPVASNPFLNQGAKPPLNLFSQEDKPLAPLNVKIDKPTESLPVSRIFNVGSSDSILGKQTQQKVEELPSSTSLIQANNDQEDVGMGGVTPPNQSPIATSASKSFIFSKQPTQTTYPMQGSGGSKTTSATPSAATSIFGGQGIKGITAPTSKPGSIFSMGKSNNPPTKALFGQSSSSSQSGSLFASAPSQGQPEINKKNSWNTNPFSSTKKDKINDGLFSEK